jgi:hypothetical protein
VPVPIAFLSERDHILKIDAPMRPDKVKRNLSVVESRTRNCRETPRKFAPGVKVRSAASSLISTVGWDRLTGAPWMLPDFCPTHNPLILLLPRRGARTSGLRIRAGRACRVHTLVNAFWRNPIELVLNRASDSAKHKMSLNVSLACPQRKLSGIGLSACAGDATRRKGRRSCPT